MALKTTLKDKPDRTTRVYRTKDKLDGASGFKWWEESNSSERGKQLVATVDYLKSIQGFRMERAASYARLYGGMPIMGFVGKSLNTVDRLRGLTPNRPTYNLISSVVDTLVSKLTQDRPQPVFLTDNGDYKERNLAKKLNNFILGEFYRTKAYEIGEYILTDALVQGTGCLKILETQDRKVGIERVLLTELFVDLQESAYGDPRRLYQVKLMDRAMVEAMFPKEKKKVAESVSARIDNTSESTRSLADLIMVVEGWSLPSGEDTGDGFHSIACSEGELFHEKYEKDKFPFVFLHHKKRPMGFWSIGTSESLMPTQLVLNSLLDTIARSIALCGVPRVFVEEGSKCNTASFVNKIGTIVKYRGAAPIFAVSPSNAPELYEERARLIQFGFEQEGLSMLSATSQKPAGLNSGEAQRVYQDINSDRFAALERRYTNFYVDLAYQIIDKAMDIAERDGKYSTVFTDRKKGCKEIELPDISLLQNPFVIQAYVQSSLPKEPAGRLQKVTEMIQSNMISIQEGRRLLDFPDLGQIETLANSSEERIFQYLDDMIEEGEYQGPDQWMDLAKATEICTQYINLYSTCNLEEEKMQMLRDFFAEIQDLQMAAMPQPPMMPPEPQNQLALPEKLPRSEMLPLGPGGGGLPQFADGGLVEDQKKNSTLTEPSFFERAKEAVTPAFQAVQKTLRHPYVQAATDILKYSSPAAYVFIEAGNPHANADLLAEFTPFHGSQLAADIPIGWKVIKGFEQNEERLTKSISEIKDKLKKISISETPDAAKKIGKYSNEIENLENQIRELRTKSPAQLEVTRTPEELAQIEKQAELNYLENAADDWDVLKKLEKKPLDEVAKELLQKAKEEAEYAQKTYPKHLSPAEKSGFKNVSQQEAEDLLMNKLKEVEEYQTKKRLRSEKFEAEQSAKKAAEEERLKNVVVPIEIEGGPLKKSNPKNRYEISKEGDRYWIIDKLHNEKTVALKTKKEAQEQIKDFVEDDLKKTGPQKIVREQQRRSDLNPEITSKQATLPEIPSNELNTYVNSELSELNTRDIDTLFEIITENLFERGMSVDRDELYRMLKSKVDPRKKD